MKIPVTLWTPKKVSERLGDPMLQTIHHKQWKLGEEYLRNRPEIMWLMNSEGGKGKSGVSHDTQVGSGDNLYCVVSKTGQWFPNVCCDFLRKHLIQSNKWQPLPV